MPACTAPGTLSHPPASASRTLSANGVSVIPRKARLRTRPARNPLAPPEESAVRSAWPRCPPAPHQGRFCIRLPTPRVRFPRTACLSFRGRRGSGPGPLAIPWRRPRNLVCGSRGPLPRRCPPAPFALDARRPRPSVRGADLQPGPSRFLSRRHRIARGPGSRRRLLRNDSLWRRGLGLAAPQAATPGFAAPQSAAGTATSRQRLRVSIAAPRTPSAESVVSRGRRRGGRGRRASGCASPRGRGRRGASPAAR